MPSLQMFDKKTRKGTPKIQFEPKLPKKQETDTSNGIIENINTLTVQQDVNNNKHTVKHCELPHATKTIAKKPIKEKNVPVKKLVPIKSNENQIPLHNVFEVSKNIFQSNVNQPFPYNKKKERQPFNPEIKPFLLQLNTSSTNLIDVYRSNHDDMYILNINDDNVDVISIDDLFVSICD